jgi:hypothetical protein
LLFSQKETKGLQMQYATSYKTSGDAMAHVGDAPDVGALNEELRRAATDFGLGTRVGQAENTRYCRWDGQSGDGKKWNDNQPNGKMAFPWDGASDTRIPLADEVVNGLVDVCSTAFWRSMLRVAPTNVRNLDTAVTAHSLMDWVMNQKLYTDMTREVELLSQYLWTYGWAGVHVSWQQEIGQKEQYVTVEQLMQIAAQSPQGSVLADLPNLLANPDATDQLAELLMAAFPNLKKRKALECVKDLREEGECEIYVPTLVKNSPSVAALAPYDELAFPPETTDIQSARVVFRRCYMTEIEVMQHVETDDWDEEWAKQAIATRGRFSNFSDYTYTIGLTNNAVLDRENLIEVVYAYQKALDEDGVPGVYCTVFCPQVGDSWGKFELIDYEHGQYPFIVWRSEVIHRKIVESRGVPEICATWQNEIKAQRDSIFDYTSLNTIPPIQVPKTRGGNLRLGPAVQIPVLRPGEISFMQPPAREPSVAFNLIAAIETQVDRYFGRPTEKVPPALTQMRQQRLVNNWLHGWTEAFRQVLSLTLQYTGPEEVARITGSNVPLSTNVQEFDVSLKFDVRELQTDLVTEKLKALSSLVLPLDSVGVVDRTKLVGLALRAIDPTLANELIMQAGPASQKMFDETNDELGLMSLGNPPKLRENDPTAQARLNFAQQILQANPKYQQQAQQDPLFQANLQKYVENLQFSVQQQQNAVTGRLGVQPGATPQ